MQIEDKANHQRRIKLYSVIMPQIGIEECPSTFIPCNTRDVSIWIVFAAEAISGARRLPLGHSGVAEGVACPCSVHVKDLRTVETVVVVRYRVGVLVLSSNFDATNHLRFHEPIDIFLTFQPNR